MRMTFIRDWYNYGGLAPGQRWPIRIENGDKVAVASIAGTSRGIVSGYVTYAMGMRNEQVTIAFSIPTAGRSKIGAGFGGKNVWYNMQWYGYQYHLVTLRIDGKTVYFNIRATGGNVNYATVDISV